MSEHMHTPAHGPLSRRDIALGLASGSLALVCTGCVTNRETGRQQVIVVSDAQLNALSVQAWADVKLKTPILRDATAIARVKTVGDRIAIGSAITGAQWEYAVFDEATVNAFVLPGGKVGVYKGLLDLCASDAELAAVMSHEAGHIAGRHSAERMSQASLAQAALSAASAGATRLPVDPAAQTAIVQALGLGVQYGVLLPFSREQEYEADRLGLRFAAKAGYDPREALSLWRKMSALGGTKPPAYLSTHPSDDSRIARITETLRTMGYQT
jgi:predicted Zn-dependent protease